LHFLRRSSQVLFIKVLIAAFWIVRLNAQDVCKVDWKNPFKISGSIGANSTFYTANGIDSRRDPFYWLINTNLNMTILGISTPFSATFSQQQRRFTQPFNQYGISPKCGAVTTHFGYRSMTFSNFSLAGNTFLGAGVEIAPQDSFVKGKAMYGRLVRPVSVGGVDGIVSGNPAYARIGFGTSINLGSDEHNMDLILFKAADDEDSIEPPLPEKGITPAENLVLGFVTTHQFAKKFFFDLEYDLSAYTTDTRGEEVVLDNFSYANNLCGLFTPNASSQFNNAILSNFTYKGQGYQLKLTYRRIDPEYKTMGSVFLANDLEDISLNTSWAMFKNKATFSVSGGFQHNNLNDEQIATLTRFISSFAVGYSFNQNLNVSANYSNFNSSTELSPILLVDEFGNPDSLNYVQTTNSAGLSINYIANPGSSVQNVFFVSGNYQGADDSEDMASRFYNFNATHQISFSLLNASINTSFNYNDNRVGEMENHGLWFARGNLGVTCRANDPWWIPQNQKGIGAAFDRNFLPRAKIKHFKTE